MKRLLTAIFGAVSLVAPVWSPIWSPAAAQEVSRRNQDTDNRPNLQSEQTVAGHTSKPGVDVQQPQPGPRSKRRRPRRASKAPPHFKIPAPGDRVVAHKTAASASPSGDTTSGAPH